MNSRLKIYLTLFSLFLLTSCGAFQIQVISGDPREFVLQMEDLPPGIRYYTPPEFDYATSNEYILLHRGVTDGQEFIDATGRLGGWLLAYSRYDPDDPAPATFSSEATLFQDSKGSRKTVSEFNSARLYPEAGWQVVDAGVKLGDQVMIERRPEVDFSGEAAVAYRIEFAFRNVVGNLYVYGLEKDLSLENAVDYAAKMLEKMKTAPLHRPPAALTAEMP